MGGLRGGRGGGGGGGFEEESDSFEAMDDAKSLSDGCELFLGGGGGGGGDESVGCCVVASMFSSRHGVPLLSEASALCSPRWRLGTAGLTHRALKQSSGLLSSRPMRLAQPVVAAVGPLPFFRSVNQRR